MIEEKAIIISTEGQFAWVETQRKSTCQSCSVNKGCGTATISKVVGNKRNMVKVLNPIEAQAGEQVVVGLQEDALVRGSLLLYALPLLLMFVVAFIGQSLALNLGVTESETLTIVFALAGLAVGFYLVKRFTDRISEDERYQAVILRKEESVIQFVN